MSYPLMQTDLLERYLCLLGIPRRKPGLEALCELVQAHMVRVPFENISKLYYKKHRGLRSLPTLELFLDGIERFHFGGTCYTNNFYFYQLLSNLGYRTMLCGADMSNPDVHVVSIVTLENREYLVDVGYAAPFLAPLPRDLTADHAVELGRDRYVLKPRDAQGRSRMARYRDGILNHGYTAKPAPRQIGDFEQVIADSFRQEATFMNALLLARFYPDRSVVMDNRTLIESRGPESKSIPLSGRKVWVQAIHENFNIPPEFIMDAVDELGQFTDAWN